MSVLQIEGLTKVYRGGVRANDDISLVLEAGEVFGLLGPNGAGKTTLVGQVLGLVRPTSGEIRLDGIDVVRNPARARELCSYQPQTAVPVEGLTPLQAIALTGRIRKLGKDEARRRAEALVERLGLGEWRDKRTALSGGVRRLVAFCMAAVAPGRVVVLDEPTNDVDPLRRKRLWDEVRALADAGSAVLLVTHNVLEAERCVDRLAIVDRGRVEVRGTPASLKAETGSTLRLEVVLEPGEEVPDRPGFAEDPLVQGRHVLMGVSPSRVGDAVAWARALQEGGRAEEFSIAPATLEDVYVRCVERAVIPEDGAAVVADGVGAP